MTDFQKDILSGIPDVLPDPKPYDHSVNHAPKRKDILTPEEKQLALRNALRYFPAKFHETLAPEFAAELRDYGRIYMYRFRPDYPMYARPIGEYPAKCPQAAAIMAMIQNNLDPRVAQHPHELIIYGGNGAIFQNWAQYRLVMQYLATMTEEQTLAMYSGHPMGLFPSHKDAPRVVVTNGMVIPNYSSKDNWERFNALGVSQYGQMTAGSYMYIGPQGIVHGTTITVMNAARKQLKARGVEGNNENMHGLLFVTAGLGGMSGAQPKAGNIAGVVSVTAEINPLAAEKRFDQGWVDELHYDLDELIPRIRKAVEGKEVVSLAYVGNVVDLWERLADIGGKLLVKTLKQIEDGTAPRIKQGEDFSMAPMLDKSIANIDWGNQSSTQIKNLVRGLNPMMGAYSIINGKKFKFWKVQVISYDEFEKEFNIKNVNSDFKNGDVIFADSKKGLFIKAIDGIISVLEIQGENAKRMQIQDFLRGNSI